MNHIPKCPICGTRSLKLWENTCPNCEKGFKIHEGAKERNKMDLWNKIEQGDFIKLESEKRTILTLKDWDMKEVEKKYDESKPAEKKIEFSATCVKTDKQFTNTSKRLLEKLRPIFAVQDKSGVWTMKPNNGEMEVAITKTGDGFKTHYFVELVEDRTVKTENV